MRFENDTITFYPYLDGSEPDLSGLSNGSLITITETLHNNGTYTVDSVLDNVVTVQSHTFTLEPNKTYEQILNDCTQAAAPQTVRNIFYETSNMLSGYGDGYYVVSGLCLAVGDRVRTLSRYETVTRLEEQNGGGYLAYITGTALDEAEYYDNTEFDNFIQQFKTKKEKLSEAKEIVKKYLKDPMFKDKKTTKNNIKLFLNLNNYPKQYLDLVYLMLNSDLVNEL